MSFLFLLSSLMTLYIFTTKVYKLQKKQRGFIKDIIYCNLICLVIYNLTYSFENLGQGIGNFLDSLTNSMMMSLLLFLNLVLIDAQTDKVRSNF